MLNRAVGLEQYGRQLSSRLDELSDKEIYLQLQQAKQAEAEKELEYAILWAEHAKRLAIAARSEISIQVVQEELVEN